MNRTPRIAAIQDISGFGRCSMTVVLPVLAAMGGQCCPLPTAYLSAHTAFPASGNATFMDMTGQMAGTAAHWKELGVSFDAIYSGFLGSAEQIDLIMEFTRGFRKEHGCAQAFRSARNRLYQYRSALPCRRMAVVPPRA